MIKLIADLFSDLLQQVMTVERPSSHLVDQGHRHTGDGAGKGAGDGEGKGAGDGEGKGAGDGAGKEKEREWLVNQLQGVL